MADPSVKMTRTTVYGTESSEAPFPIRVSVKGQVRQAIILGRVRSQGENTMCRKVEKHRALTDAELVNLVCREPSNRDSNLVLDNVRLSAVPIEERKREAEKPLFLVRYE